MRQQGQIPRRDHPMRERHLAKINRFRRKLITAAHYCGYH